MPLDKKKRHSCQMQKVWMDPCQDQRENNLGTRGSWKKRPFCWSLVEASDYRHQDLPLTKGWYKGKVSVDVTENSRKPLGMSTVDQEPKAGCES